MVGVFDMHVYLSHLQHLPERMPGDVCVEAYRHPGYAGLVTRITYLPACITYILECSSVSFLSFFVSFLSRLMDVRVDG